MEIAVMISEATFARGYSSFWNGIIPWINQYTKAINERYLTSLMNPIKGTEDPSYRSINSIIAFNIYRNKCQGKTITLDESFRQTKDEIKNYPRNNLDKYIFDKNNENIIKQLSDRLFEIYFSKDILIDPFFPGCGVMANCKGDILFENSLVEIKSGERTLQASDIKQLLVYCGLNEIAGKKYKIDKIVYFNPRMGVLWNGDINLVFRSISSITLVDFYQDLEDFLISMSIESIM
jgi:hypothetical protein